MEKKKNHIKFKVKLQKMQKVKRKGSIYLKICINKQGGKTDINIRKKFVAFISSCLYLFCIEMSPIYFKSKSDWTQFY